MRRSAKETIEEFWRVQDAGDYSLLVDLFAEDALLVDPVYGTFQGKAAIRGFMEKMNAVMRDRNIDFVAEEIDGGGEVAWAQWVARTPQGNIEGCGLYRVRDGLLTYYRDYMNAEPEAAETGTG